MSKTEHSSFNVIAVCLPSLKYNQFIEECQIGTTEKAEGSVFVSIRNNSKLSRLKKNSDENDEGGFDLNDEGGFDLNQEIENLIHVYERKKERSYSIYTQILLD